MQELTFYDPYTIWVGSLWNDPVMVFLVRLLIVGAIIALSWIVWQLYKRSRAQKNYFEKALDDLAALQQKPCTTKLEGKLLYYQLLQIIKRYFATRFKDIFEAKTDAEFVESIAAQSNRYSKETILSIRAIVEGAYGVKYADDEAVANQLYAHIEQAVTLIKQHPIEK